MADSFSIKIITCIIYPKAPVTSLRGIFYHEISVPRILGFHIKFNNYSPDLAFINKKVGFDVISARYVG